MVSYVDILRIKNNLSNYLVLKNWVAIFVWDISTAVA